LCFKNLNTTNKACLKTIPTVLVILKLKDFHFVDDCAIFTWKLLWLECLYTSCLLINILLFLENITDFPFVNLIQLVCQKPFKSSAYIVLRITKIIKFSKFCIKCSLGRLTISKLKRNENLAYLNLSGIFGE
jgi:hypothetical protein